MILHTFQTILRDNRVGLVLQISLFGELGVVGALLGGLAVSIPGCGCYGLPVQWRTMLVNPGGGGTVYSATSFILDAVFFAALGRLALLAGSLYGRYRAGLRTVLFSYSVVIAIGAVLLGVTFAILDAWSFYNLHRLPVLGP